MEDFSVFTVMVEGGSGCLFLPMSADYAYVLTARHVISESVLPLSIVWQRLNENGDVINTPLVMIAEPFYHSDGDKFDSAIIKVENTGIKEVLPELMRIDNPLVFNTEFILAGHPDTRGNQVYSYRENALKLKNKKAYNYIEAELERVATHSEIVGQSGGGIFSIKGGHFFLAGIQKKMSMQDNKETLGRMDFMPLTFFDAIIEENPDDLVPLLPYFMTSFEFLKDQVMKIEGCFVPDNVDYTRDFLRGITDKIVGNQLTPIFVKDFFKGKLLAGKNPNLDLLMSKNLWTAWLEYLIILNLLKDNEVREDNLEGFFNCYRVLFSDTEKDWSKDFNNIMQSDFYGLSENGCIIVSSVEKPEKEIIPAGAIFDIIRTNTVQKSQMQIDEGIEHPFKNYKLIHLYAFQKKCIIEKEFDYKDFSSLTETQLISKLKQEYEELLK